MYDCLLQYEDSHIIMAVLKELLSFFKYNFA